MNLIKKIIFFLATLMLVVLFWLTIFGNNGFFDLHRLKREKINLVEKNAKITQDNLESYRVIKRLKNDPRFIENVARQELGMIGKDEVIFKFRKTGEEKND